MFGAYNICNSHNGGLESELRGVYQANMDLGIFQKTKVTDGFHLSTGERWWYIVGCYLAPDDTSTIESVVAALKERPRGAGLLVVGDFNVNLSDS